MVENINLLYPWQIITG